MLFQTSLVALVGIGDEPTMSPRRLQITNTKVLLVLREGLIYSDIKLFVS